MRPLTLAERGLETPTVSLGGLLTGERPAVEGSTVVRLGQYVAEISPLVFQGFAGTGTGRSERNSTGICRGSSTGTSTKQGTGYEIRRRLAGG